MRFLALKQLDEQHEQIAEALISLGMTRPVARILSYFQNGNEVTSMELEKETGLRQPEVSIAMRELKERGWVNERDEKKNAGKGRPYKIYTLKMGFKDITAEIEKEQKKSVDESRAKIKRLKDLMK